MTKNYNTLEHENLQSLIDTKSDCGFAYSPKWIGCNVKHKEK